MLSGIMQAAFDHGYQISLLPTNYDQELEKRYLAEFAKRAFDGLIAWFTKGRITPIFLVLPKLRF
jgi:DNA-binding LacI/PurR family transcriptional regulator